MLFSMCCLCVGGFVCVRFCVCPFVCLFVCLTVFLCLSVCDYMSACLHRTHCSLVSRHLIRYPQSLRHHSQEPSRAWAVAVAVRVHRRPSIFFELWAYRPTSHCSVLLCLRSVVSQCKNRHSQEFVLESGVIQDRWSRAGII